MKVAFFNSTQAWGGGEKWHFEMSTGLYEKGWDTVVYANKNSELSARMHKAGVAIHDVSISNLSFLNPFKIRSLVASFQKERIRTIILNLSADLKAAGIAAKLAGIETIIYRRGSAIPIQNSWMNRQLFRKVITHVIANSSETKKTILANNPRLIPEENITVIYNGLNFSKYENGGSIPSFPKKNGEIVIGNLGRLVKQKSQHSLIDLAVLLKKRNLPVRILIGGAGPLEENLKLETREKGVEEMVTFTGFINDIKGFMLSIDIFILTSLWEGFGYVIAEAMYFKKPVIAFDVSSNPELIDDGKDGFLIPSGDLTAMAGSVEYFCINTSLMAQFGETGHEKVTGKFSFNKSLDNLMSLIASL